MCTCLRPVFPQLQRITAINWCNSPNTSKQIAYGYVQDTRNDSILLRSTTPKEGLVRILRIIYFYHRTLSALPHDELSTLEPGTRSRISARFMAPGHETPRARRRGAHRAGGRRPRPSGDVCAESLRLEGSPETRGVPSSGAGPSQNGTCSGGDIGRKIRAGGSAINYFWFGRTRVCIALVSLHRVEEWVLSGKKSYHGASQSGTCLGGGIGSKIRAGKSTLNYFRFGKTRIYTYTPVRLHRVKEKHGLFGGRTTASSRCLLYTSPSPRD